MLLNLLLIRLGLVVDKVGSIHTSTVSRDILSLLTMLLEILLPQLLESIESVLYLLLVTDQLAIASQVVVGMR